jgi:hypothetical protein
LLCDDKQVAADRRVDVGKSGHVNHRHDQQVPCGNRLNVHERHATVVAMHDARWGEPGHDAAEHA